MAKKQKYRWTVDRTDKPQENFNGVLIKVVIQEKYAEFKESNGQPRIYFDCEKIFGKLLKNKLGKNTDIQKHYLYKLETESINGVTNTNIV